MLLKWRRWEESEGSVSMYDFDSLGGTLGKTHNLNSMATKYSEWKKPKVTEGKNLCSNMQDEVGYNIDAFYSPGSNRIYTCFEESDTQAWKDYSISHEEGHAFAYTALSEKERKAMYNVYDKKKEKKEKFVTKYSEQNADEYFAEMFVNVKDKGYKGETDLDKALVKALNKLLK